MEAVLNQKQAIDGQTKNASSEVGCVGGRESMIDEDVLECIKQMKNLREEKPVVSESVARISVTPRLPANLLKDKIDTALANHQQLVLIYTQGTYNPPHLGHLNMVLDAREKLESMGNFCVVASMMAPSPDKHIVSKIKLSEKKIDSLEERGEYLHLQHGERCFLVEKMLWNRGLQDSIYVDRWEGLMGKVSVTVAWLTMQVWFEEQVQAYLATRCAGDEEEAGRLLKQLEPQVAFLIGSDKLNYARSMDQMNSKMEFKGRTFHLPVIIKQRSDQNNEGAERKMQKIIAFDKAEAIAQKLYVCNSRPNYSSTQFRAQINLIEGSEKKQKKETKDSQTIDQE